MSSVSSAPISTDLNNIRQNYDTSNPVIAEILKAKEERLKILLEWNKQQQEELGLVNHTFSETVKNKIKEKTQKKRKVDTSFPQISLRRSVRLQNSPNSSNKTESHCNSEPHRTQIIRPPNDYGPVPGVEVGFHWETRMECSQYGVHRPTVAGIHGGPDGAYSIALSGGYPEDIDEGDTFIYTGAGGRDLKGTAKNPKNLRTAPQTKDQQLEGTNLSLVKSIESKLPIRVIRGYKSPSIFAPETGYRYDGLYQVVNFWADLGKTGHRIYRFKMVRMKNQAPPPWEKTSQKTKRETLRESKERMEDDATENDSSEFKENIKPSENTEGNQVSRNISDREIKDVENEIQMCVNFFFKVAPVDKVDYLKDNHALEEFLGWD